MCRLVSNLAYIINWFVNMTPSTMCNIGPLTRNQEWVGDFRDIYTTLFKTQYLTPR